MFFIIFKNYMNLRLFFLLLNWNFILFWIIQKSNFDPYDSNLNNLKLTST